MTTLYRSGRATVYPNEIVSEEDILRTNLYKMVDIAMLAQTLIGNGNALADCVAGLACTPTGPASFSVNIAPGSYYSYQQIDATAYSSLPADTTDYIYKQYVLYAASVVSGFVAPISGTNYYLIQAKWETVNQNPTATNPYFDSNNPANPLFVDNSDTRQDTITISTKLSTVSTPAPDAGYVGLYAVTIPTGSPNINAGMIAVYPSAPFITGSIFDSMNYANFQNQYPIYAVAGGTLNALTATPAVTYAALAAGQRVVVKATATNSGAATLNVSGGGVTAIRIVTNAGLVALSGGEIQNGGEYIFTYDGTYWQLLNPSTLINANQPTINQANLVGVTDASNAAAGSIGEIISNQVLSASAISLTNGVDANITSISVTAGDWNIEGNAFVEFNVGGHAVECWISTTSATRPDASLYSVSTNGSDTQTNLGARTPFYRLNVSTTTTVYLSCRADFGGGSSVATGCGGIFARRIR